MQSGFRNDKIELTEDFQVDFPLNRPEKIQFSLPVIIENCVHGAKPPFCKAVKQDIPYFEFHVREHIKN